MTNRVKIVLAMSPKISDQPNPEKIGSSVTGMADSIAAPAVKRIGRNRTTRLSRIASKSGRPAATACSMKSTKMIESRVTIPERAIMPIIAVAVKYTGSA